MSPDFDWLASGYGNLSFARALARPKDNLRARDGTVRAVFLRAVSALTGVHPNVPEACNDLDDDCDGMRDEGRRTTTEMGLVIRRD